MSRVWLLMFGLSVALTFDSLPLMADGSDGGTVFTEEERSHWSFQEVKRHALPSTTRSDWVRNPIDAWILKELEFASLTPSPEADRTILIRRASLDLLGLPPSLEEVSQFVNDDSPEAYDKMVDRLLASPAYGERWGRHWLDLAMYAESAGFEQDETRPNLWRYRDYVIQSLNQDKGYDRFVLEQLAGDELWPKSIEARIATGFMRHYPEEGNNKDILLARQEILHHITDVVGSTFLGLTMNCAQCHDHKYDPIRQRDYYRFQAFFANIGHDDKQPIVDERSLDEYVERLRAYEAATDHLWAEMDGLLAKVRKYSPKQLLARYPDYVIEAMHRTDQERNPIQRQIAYIVDHKDCGTCPQRPKPHSDPAFANDAKSLKGEAKERFEQLKVELERLKSLKPKDVERASGMIDISQEAPKTYVLGIGQYTQPKQEVEPGFLSILDPSPAKIERPGGIASTGRRTALARWITDRSHPLTARVMVNRIWHYHFGRGIAGSPSDFGVMGDPPTHPELLDWLALSFMENGWSIKSLHRLILTSATYRQSSFPRPEITYDPNNRLLWRFPAVRLEGEAIRDSALYVAGLLDRRVGGESVFPPLPEGRPTPVGGWKTSPQPQDHVRRSVYIFVRRNDRYPFLEAFDFPDSHESCPCRNQTMTAPQSLALLNGDQPMRWSKSLASRILSNTGDDRIQQVRLAMQLLFSRLPDENEMALSLEFLDRQSALIAEESKSQKSDEKNGTEEEEAIHLNGKNALADFCLMLINSGEFVYRN